MALPIHRFLSGLESGTRPLQGLGREASYIGRRARTFIFDIDNTLTHGEDQHLWPLPESIRGFSNPVDLQRRFIPDDENVFQIGQNWDQWNAARAHAIPNTQTIDLLKDIRGAGYNLMGLTARTREADDITRQWLRKHGLGETPFVSRSLSRGEESSSISKGWAIDQLRAQGVVPIGGIEDSASNIKMFTEKGIPHAQVERGQIVHIPEEMPTDIRAMMKKAQGRPSTARMQMAQQQSVGGYIDDPLRTNPHMRTRPSSGRQQRLF